MAPALHPQVCPSCTYRWNTVGPEGSAVHLSKCPRCFPSKEIVSAATDCAEALVYLTQSVEARVAAGRVQLDIDLQIILRRAHDALHRAGISP